MPTFYEFFCGGGMARQALSLRGWDCALANDISDMKAEAYAANWGWNRLIPTDVADLSTHDLPGRADLAWASFPCQDLSLAGKGAGLGGEHSGAFWPFMNLIKGLVEEGRAPRIVALENVTGAITSHGGLDFTAICVALDRAGYRVGALVIDASNFVPQSRERLFIVGVHKSATIPPELLGTGPDAAWHTPALRKAVSQLGTVLGKRWVWWSLPQPSALPGRLEKLLEPDEAVERLWLKADDTLCLLGMMDEKNLSKVRQAQRSGRRTVGTLFKRTRNTGEGGKKVRAEVRFDGVAGCLRTAAGGSSRQSVLIVDGPRIRARLLSARETARLMGLPDTFKLPTNFNDALNLTGDGVVAPVVAHLAQHIFEPVLAMEKANA